MSEDITFGAWLKQQRRNQGIGPEELAQQVGCSTITLLKIEAGERRSSRQLALILAEFFHVPADEVEAFVAFARTGEATTSAGSADNDERPSTVNEATPWRRAYVGRTNLPVMLTRLVGRGHEMAAARDRILEPKTRLLTLTGAPGIGKTRLALEVASTLQEHFEDGVYLSELAAITNPELVIVAIARSLQVRETGGESIDALLVKYLADKRMLLLLDNFEQVLDAASAVVSLLQTSPWLKVLVTSREALHVRGERQFPVTPLELPDASLYKLVASGEWRVARMDHAPLAGLARNPCVELLVEQASAANPGFALTEGNAQDIAAICVSLEGLPLAIELAANAVSFSPAQAREALRHRLRLLSEGARDLPPRQRTLRNAIEWSYELLEDGERKLFRRLAVFVGGFTPESVEAVANHDQVLPFSVREGVALLVRKSLIKEEGRASEMRFGMLDTLRDYSLEKLGESGEEEELRTQHARYFMLLAEEAEPHLRSADQLEWLARLEDEHANMQAALHFVRKLGDAKTGLRTVAALWRFWSIHGYLTEGREQISGVLSLTDDLSSSAEATTLRPFRAGALHGQGVLARMQGDYDVARSLLEESLALYRELGNKHGVGLALNSLAVVLGFTGENAQARSLHEQSLAIHEELGDKWGIAAALANLGIATHAQSDYLAARSLHERSLALSREIGDKRGIAGSLSSLAFVAYRQGDYESARLLHEECLAIRRELGDRPGIAYSLFNLGSMTRYLGDYVSARALAEEAVAMFRELGEKEGLGYSISNLGSIAHVQGGYAFAVPLHEESLAVFTQSANQRGMAHAKMKLGLVAYLQEDYASSLSLHRESLELRKGSGNKHIVAFSLAHLGAVAVAIGQVREGVRLLGAATAILEATGVFQEPDDRVPYEAGLALARAHLGEDEFATLLAEGRNMTIEEAIDHALNL